VIDTERIFSYRALQVSRNDKTSLPGFDENDYVSNTDARHLQSLLTELSIVRQSTLALLKFFSTTIRAFRNCCIYQLRNQFILIGHQKHHQKNI
jgi:hypothetical protein